MNTSGKCLCGSIVLKAPSRSEHTGACHCSTCRKWGGGPYMSVQCGEDVTIEGEQHLGVFSSSEWAERGFCKECGTHLFYRLKSSKVHFVPAGLFDGEPAFEFTHQVFIDEKPDYYGFANQTKEMTGAEVFAMYAPKEPAQ